MMLQKQPELLWVVVEVASGIPVTVEVYQDKQSAGKREQFLRAHMHPGNDETGVFEVQIERPVPLASESSSPK